MVNILVVCVNYLCKSDLIHIYSEENPTKLNGTSSQVSLHRISTLSFELAL